MDFVQKWIGSEPENMDPSLKQKIPGFSSAVPDGIIGCVFSMERKQSPAMDNAVEKDESVKYLAGNQSDLPSCYFCLLSSCIPALCNAPVDDASFITLVPLKAGWNTVAIWYKGSKNLEYNQLENQLPVGRKRLQELEKTSEKHSTIALWREQIQLSNAIA